MAVLYPNLCYNEVYYKGTVLLYSLLKYPMFLFITALGYHKDPQTRAAFMEVLTKILQQGTEFETLAETALADRFERLVELVTMIGDKGELPIAMALATVVPTQQMVSIRNYQLPLILTALLWIA